MDYNKTFETLKKKKLNPMGHKLLTYDCLFQILKYMENLRKSGTKSA